MKIKSLICPHCKQQGITFYMGAQFGQYLCKHCGYIGPLVIEQIPGKESRKKIKKRK